MPSSQDKVFVFLHKGAVVGGKEVSITLLLLKMCKKLNNREQDD